MIALGRFATQLRDVRAAALAARVRTGPIGVWSLDGELRAAQLRRDADGRIVTAGHGAVPAPANPDGLRRAFARLRDSLGLTGRRIVTVLPEDLARIFTVSYTVDSRGDDAPALLRAVADRLEGDPEEWVVDRLPVRGGADERQRLAIVVAARRESVVAHAEGWRRAGAELVALEVAPTAIRRLMSVLGEHREYNVLVLEMRRERSDISLYSGRRLHFHQTLAFGADRLVASVASALATDPGEALDLLRRYGTASAPLAGARTPVAAADDVLVASCAGSGSTSGSISGSTSASTEAREIASTLREIVHPELVVLVDQINRALMFAASENRGQSVEEIRLLGDLAVWPGAPALLERLLMVRVDTFAAALGAMTDDDADAPRDPVAVGLALRSLVDQDGD